MKSILLNIAFILYAFGSLAQVSIDFPEKKNKETIASSTIDLNGLWEGEVSQLTWLGQPEFAGVKGKLHVEIEQKGSIVNGLLVCRAKFANNKGYLSYEKIFKGNWNGKVLQYEDVSVENYINTHKELRHLETCIKQSNLEFYKAGNYMFLEGDWQGNGHISEVSCVPGKITLRKILEEELVLEEAQTINVNFEEKPSKSEDVKWARNDKIKKLRNRKVKDGKTIKVDSNYISITVYDHKKDDGDIISLNYNNKWILEEFEIDKKEFKLDVFLDERNDSPNFLVLYAHNLGLYPPNTVAIIVEDGSRKQRFILNADMDTSDVIYFERE